MLAGTGDEEGRIGFVALTRVRDLLVVAIPNNTSNAAIQTLKEKGFSGWSAPERL